MDTNFGDGAVFAGLHRSSPEPSGSLRQRILEESAQSAKSSKQGKRVGTPWSLKPPTPGTSVWDVRDLEEVRVVQGKRKKPPTWDSFSESKCSKLSFEDGPNYSSTSNNDPMMDELEQLCIEAKSKEQHNSQASEPAKCSGVDGIDLPTLKTKRPETRTAVQQEDDHMTRISDWLETHLEARSISEEQLINEIKGIYVGLVLVEKECIEISQANSESPTKELSNEQWKSLVALQRTILREQEDFLLACQHPLASKTLQKLALQYDLPGRLWRNSNKAILELLRRRIPDHLENMIAYIYLSFSMLLQLNTKFPELGERWAECMQDLETYRDFLERIRANDSDSDIGLSPSSVACQYLPDWPENGEPSGNDNRDMDAAFEPPQKGIQQDFPVLSAGQSVHGLFGADGTELRESFGQPFPLNDDVGGSIDDETNIQEEFDRWFGELNPNLFDTEGKNKWVLLGWLHFGKRIASNFWSYRRVFKILLLNVLL